MKSAKKRAKKQAKRKVRPIPKGYHTVTPYLAVKGAAQLLDFVKRAFGAKERMRMPGPNGTIMHAEITLGDSIVMLADPPTDPMPAMIHIYVKNVDSVYKAALKAGAESVREPADQFYGDRSAGVKDAFGNQWWLSTHVEDVSPKEMQKRAQAHRPTS
jgi:uncharacterized glyoxalase superfamily protein PhnB